MDNDRYNNWKVAFKFFSLGVVIIGVGWTAYTYFHDKSAESKNLEEARKKEQNSIVYKHQADLYFDTARAAATIATALDPTAKDAKTIDAKTLRDARERFAQLFWGELAPIEDRRVELATIAFQRCLLNNGKGCDRVGDNQHGEVIKATELNENGDATLQNLSLEIGACIRSAFQQERKISFSPSSSDDRLKKKAKYAITTCPYE